MGTSFSLTLSKTRTKTTKFAGTQFGVAWLEEKNNLLNISGGTSSQQNISLDVRRPFCLHSYFYSF